VRASRHARRFDENKGAANGYTPANGGLQHLTDARFFALVTGLALVSLLLTFVLFRFLAAQAEGQGKLLGGTIKYGGSLAGFVLIFSILFGAFSRLRADPGVMTPIALAGEWSIEVRPSKGAVETGTVTIRQRSGDPVLQMDGALTGAGATTFSTVVGVIRDRNVYFIYENLDGERGMIRGQVPNDSPATLRFVYTDLTGYDRNEDASGVLLLSKRP
jgi:hypothetical protein